MKDNLGSSGKRDAILAAALYLFTTYGFHATPTSAISRHAGVSTGTLFHYFPLKQSLIDELYLLIKRELHDIIRDDTDMNGSVREALEGGFRRYINWKIQYREKALFLEQFVHSPNISQSVQSTAREEFSWIDAIFSRAVQEGVLPDLPVQVQMVFILQILDGIVTILLLEDTGLSREEVIAAGFAKVWKR